VLIVDVSFSDGLLAVNVVVDDLLEPLPFGVGFDALPLVGF
jgi:hypothetical protein